MAAKAESPKVVNSQTQVHKKREPNREDHQLFLLPTPQHRLNEIHLLKWVSQLDVLSSAIHKFRTCFDDLTNHLNYIEKSIDARTAPSTPPSLFPSPNAETPQKDTKTTPERSQIKNENNNNNNNIIITKERIIISGELKALCANSNGKALKKYIIRHKIGHDSKLREELPIAIRSAQNPGRLVLDCVGRFYVQGKKAFEKIPNLVHMWQVTVLVLEAFLVASEEGTEVEDGVRRDAETGAALWMARLLKEGGLGLADKMDVKGLMLLVACFGIPKEFQDYVLLDLVMASNLQPFLLRKSPILLTRITDILERMMKKDDMKIEAIDVVIAFGMEDKFPLENILAKYLQGCDQAFNRRKSKAKNDLIVLKETNERHLTTLKSALRFIEDHKLNSMKLPPEWQLKEMIRTLNKENADLSQKMQKIGKRKTKDGNELNQETKRPRFASKDLSLLSSQSTGLHERASASHVNEKIRCNGSTQKEILDGGLPPPINGHPATETLSHVSSPGSPPKTEQHEQRIRGHSYFKSSYSSLENNHPSESAPSESGAGFLPGNVPGLIGAGIPCGEVGPLSIYDGPSTGFFDGVQRRIEVDRTRLMIGSIGQTNGGSSARDDAEDDWPTGQSLVGQPAFGLFGPSSSIERFVGFPNSPRPGATWSSADLYRFVDAVVEMEYGRNSIKVVPSQPVVEPRCTSYMY